MECGRFRRPPCSIELPRKLCEQNTRLQDGFQSCFFGKYYRSPKSRRIQSKTPTFVMDGLKFPNRRGFAPHWRWKPALMRVFHLWSTCGIGKRRAERPPTPRPPSRETSTRCLAVVVAVLDAIEARAPSFRGGEASSIDEKSASDSACSVSSAVRDTDVSLAASAASSAMRMRSPRRQQRRPLCGCVSRGVK